MLRGNYRQIIFQNDEDRQGKFIRRFALTLIAFDYNHAAIF